MREPAIVPNSEDSVRDLTDSTELKIVAAIWELSPRREKYHKNYKKYKKK